MSSNPYQSPDQMAGESTATHSVAKAAQPFSLQAARFAFYAPFMVMFINLILVEPQRRSASGDTSGVGFAFSLIAALTILAGFAFGVVGLVGGIRRKAVGTILFAALGTLINGLLAYSVIILVVHVIQRRGG